ncbi:hypothetical protein [Actinomadura sp. 9N407]|uniref:hypothetical protein n=1 Tax=Actinomadura sp. 9N407 TaxID=3375154 RepID=UPI00379F5C6B
MIACYAEGGGLGHLTRIRAFLHTVGYDGPATVLTSSPFAADPRVRGSWRVLGPPYGPALAALAPAELIIDAFPAGLKGELTAGDVPSGTKVTHLARLLRWDAYRPLIPPDAPRFDRTLVLEELAPEHLAYLQDRSGEIAPLELVDPPAEVSDPVIGVDGWLIVHAGPEPEIMQLIAYAQDVAAMEGLRPSLTLVAPVRPPGLPGAITHRDLYPVRLPAGFTGRIFTAAGFNSVRRLAPWRDRHRILPFPRTLDDQFTRAARARPTGPTGPTGQSRRSNVI